MSPTSLLFLSFFRLLAAIEDQKSEINRSWDLQIVPRWGALGDLLFTRLSTLPRPEDKILSEPRGVGAMQLTPSVSYSLGEPSLCHLDLLGYGRGGGLVEIRRGTIGGLTDSLRSRVGLPCWVVLIQFA